MQELSELKESVHTNPISQSALGLGLCLLQLHAVIFLMTHCLPSWQNKKTTKRLLELQLCL